MNGRFRAPVVALLALALLVGCTPNDPATRQPTGSDMTTQPSAEKSGTGELRHDTEPLTSRFAPLDGLQSASWMSGTLGDAPGPSTYWIDAIVTLSVEQYESLRSTSDVTPASDAPPVIAALAAELPEGAYVRSSELNAQFSLEQYRTEVFLNDDTRTLVLLSVFQ